MSYPTDNRPMEDLVGCLNSCTESFAQLVALGGSVACDMENFAGSTLEQLQARVVTP